MSLKVAIVPKLRSPLLQLEVAGLNLASNNEILKYFFSTLLSNVAHIVNIKNLMHATIQLTIYLCSFNGTLLSILDSIQLKLYRTVCSTQLTISLFSRPVQLNRKVCSRFKSKLRWTTITNKVCKIILVLSKLGIWIGLKQLLINFVFRWNLYLFTSQIRTSFYYTLVLH